MLKIGLLHPQGFDIFIWPLCNERSLCSVVVVYLEVVDCQSNVQEVLDT